MGKKYKQTFFLLNLINILFNAVLSKDAWILANTFLKLNLFLQYTNTKRSKFNKTIETLILFHIQYPIT